MKNYFAILGVDLEADEDEIREARRLKAESAHPDHGGSVDDMVLINEAFMTLTKGRNKYLLLLSGLPKCYVCEGKGVTRKQKSFSRVVSQTCAACDGAGVTGLE